MRARCASPSATAPGAHTGAHLPAMVLHRVDADEDSCSCCRCHADPYTGLTAARSDFAAWTAADQRSGTPLRQSPSTTSRSRPHGRHRIVGAAGLAAASGAGLFARSPNHCPRRVLITGAASGFGLELASASSPAAISSSRPICMTREQDVVKLGEKCTYRADVTDADWEGAAAEVGAVDAGAQRRHRGGRCDRERHHGHVAPGAGHQPARRGVRLPRVRAAAGIGRADRDDVVGGGLVHPIKMSTYNATKAAVALAETVDFEQRERHHHHRDLGLPVEPG